MTKDPEKRALIIEQVGALGETAEDALRILATEYGLDAFTTRQRLIGGGLAHLGNGPHEKVFEIATLLGKAGLKSWIIRPTRPRFGPRRLQKLSVEEDERIHFSTREGRITVTPAHRAVAVLADISGALVDKQMKRLMVRNVYRGTVDSTRPDPSETRRTILLGQPVYDIYLIDDEDRVEVIIRALPGKFDPKGLGEAASLSARGNLGALVDLTERFFENISLHTDFGISHLPGCQLKRQDDGSDWQMQNLKHVTRFGWLMCDLHLQEQRHRKPVQEEPDASIGSVAAATLLGHPELAASGALKEVPGIGNVLGEIDRAATETQRSASEPENRNETGLPMPPDPPQKSFSWRVVAVNFALFAGLGLVFALADGSRTPAWLMRYGYETGLFPAVGAGVLFWGGFNFFLLRRRAENTPTSKIRSLAMGMVEIHGRARRKYALVAPMTSTPCVYYRLRIYRRETRGKNRRTWRLKSDSSSGHVPFYVEDATGRVTVDPRRAAIRAGSRQEGYSGQGNILLGGGSSYDDNEKWVEEVIHEGTFLYILGDARLQRSKRKTLRELKIEKLRDLKLDRAAMQKYDVDGDGQIDADEWQTAREEVEEQVLLERLTEERAPARQEDDIVIARSGHRSHPFVIAATESEAHLTRNYALYSSLLLLASLALGIWALVKTINYFTFL